MADTDHSDWQVTVSAPGYMEDREREELFTAVADAVHDLDFAVARGLDVSAGPRVPAETTADRFAIGSEAGALEVDGEAGAWYVRVLDELVDHADEVRPVRVDWTRDGRLVGVELLPAVSAPTRTPEPQLMSAAELDEAHRNTMAGLTKGFEPADRPAPDTEETR